MRASSSFRLPSLPTSLSWIPAMYASCSRHLASCSSSTTVGTASKSTAGRGRLPAAQTAAPVPIQDDPSSPVRRVLTPVSWEMQDCTHGMRQPPPTISTECSSSEPAAVKASFNVVLSCPRMSEIDSSREARVKFREMSTSSGRKHSRTTDASLSMESSLRALVRAVISRYPRLEARGTSAPCFDLICLHAWSKRCLRMAKTPELGLLAQAFNSAEIFPSSPTVKVNTFTEA
mmetsp:Transcript_28411/g.68270  ORF Transcript_28411/g.68270 Transcript_28411/m.68270 type:complete len:232 (-) Transcript_28411:423-1118(-)